MNVQIRWLIARALLLVTISLSVPGSSQTDSKDLGIVRLRYVTIVVRDYDEALNWYTNILGLEKTADGTFGKGQRWLVVSPRGRTDLGIVLEIAKPYSTGKNISPATAKDTLRTYENRVGTETRWVFEVEDCRRFYERASKRGVKFVETPVDQPWGVTEATFQDLYGNLFVVQSSRANLPR